MSKGSSDSEADSNSFSNSARAAFLRSCVSVRGAGILDERGEQSSDSCFAERPPGIDLMFSFWVSMASKSIKSPTSAMAKGVKEQT